VCSSLQIYILFTNNNNMETQYKQTKKLPLPWGTYFVRLFSKTTQTFLDLLVYNLYLRFGVEISSFVVDLTFETAPTLPAMRFLVTCIMNRSRTKRSASSLQNTSIVFLGNNVVRVLVLSFLLAGH
jgi:hypothetical protein